MDNDLVQHAFYELGVLGTTWKTILLRDVCVYCFEPFAVGLDHIVPMSKGGPNGWQNRAPACRACDDSKGSLSLLVFLNITREAQGVVAQRSYRSPNDRRAARLGLQKRIAKRFFCESDMPR